MIAPCGSRSSLLEVVAAPGQAHAAVTFGLALTRESVAAMKASRDAAIMWIREGAAAVETGDAYGPGLMSLGISPDNLIVVAARTQAEALRAALEGARCSALSAVILETGAAVDLTASRRLKLASEASGVAVVLVRLSDEVMANAARARWRVAAAPQAVTATAGSLAAFEIEVLKHPAGHIGKTCIVEWDHARHCFAEALSLSVAAVSDVGPLAA